MTRVGKIARLPQHLREELNQRIEDGEPGRQLVEWLNACGVVKETLAEHFGGRPISEQNLCEWKQGGFKDWQRHQETRALAREFLAEAEELQEEVGDTPMTDRLNETVTLALAQLLRAVMTTETDAAKQRAAVLEITREYGRIRRGDHVMEQMLREHERREAEQEAAEKAEFEQMKQGLQVKEDYADYCFECLKKDHAEKKQKGSVSEEEEARYQEIASAVEKWRSERRLRKNRYFPDWGDGEEYPGTP